MIDPVVPVPLSSVVVGKGFAIVFSRSLSWFSRASRQGRALRWCLLLLAAVGMLQIASAVVARTQGLPWFNLVQVTGISHVGDRYVVAVIDDQFTPDTCVMAVTDTQTGALALTSIPTSSCTERRRLMAQPRPQIGFSFQ